MALDVNVNDVISALDPARRRKIEDRPRRRRETVEWDWNIRTQMGRYTERLDESNLAILT